ncbi:MAG: DUF1015 family protein [Lachnospiraceae bacterium]|nr:DUF1015 family protein [Lachnospiraceae bacterium]MDE7436433.1 DUF1015 family protein [Lachnospiraceae bacterium]
MADIRPFCCIRPVPEEAAQIAALPYDVYNREEAKAAVAGNDRTFLRIDRAETQFDDSVDTYAPQVYEKAHDLLWEMVEQGDYIQDASACYYIYELTMNGRTQTGIVACASIDDYVNQVIKKHENTRADKELDRICHVDACDAQTGPIFLAYRSNEIINRVVTKVKALPPVYDFTAEDGIGHRAYIIDEPEDIKAIREAFERIGDIYIADGHHRAASAVKVGLKRRDEHPGYDGTEEFNYFLSVLFPDDQLMIMDYNRVVKDLNGMDEASFLERMQSLFEVGEPQAEAVSPGRKGEFCMYLKDRWYRCGIRKCDRSADPVEGLDVSVLQNVLLSPVLGIEDPKTDRRIDFVGGIRGLKELERRVHTDCKAAFAMYPTDIAELFAVADAGLLMPPKSTWFEPKLRSGLFIHALSR